MLRRGASLLAAAVVIPIPQGLGASSLPPFQGAPASPAPISAPAPPRHPFMAANDRSNIHDDAYMSDTAAFPGPLGLGGAQVRSASENGECASITFDARGRLVTVCVGLAGPTLQMIDPVTLETIASFPLPPRDPTAGNPFTSFGGGGYYYLDAHDRAVIPTTTRHVVVVGEQGDAFVQERDYDATAVVPQGDQIISALPDWSGRIWLASRNGVVATIDPASGALHALDTHEPIGNSFAVDEGGGVYIVSDSAMYRFTAGIDGAPVVSWRTPYANVGVVKPGQTERGSGTTPTLMGSDLVSITDNADPMDVVVLNRHDGSVLCTVPVFDKGASDTDQSLIATDRSIVVENNYGYSGPAATEQGKSTTPGLERIDVDPAGGGCRVVWRSPETAPSAVAKLSLATGLVYTYTKPPRSDGLDEWDLTAIDFATGRTVFKALGGEGLGFNNNYAPVTLGPDGTAYLGVLGGIVSWRDRNGGCATGTACAAPAASPRTSRCAARGSRGASPRRRGRGSSSGSGSRASQRTPARPAPRRARPGGRRAPRRAAAPRRRPPSGRLPARAAPRAGRPGASPRARSAPAPCRG
jgi:hypothetical protein